MKQIKKTSIGFVLIKGINKKANHNIKDKKHSMVWVMCFAGQQFYLQPGQVGLQQERLHMWFKDRAKISQGTCINLLWPFAKGQPKLCPA